MGLEMKCESEIIMIVRADTVQQNTSIFNDENNDELITCKLTCQNTKSYDHQISKSNNRSDFCDYWTTTTFNSDIENINDHSRIDVTLKLKDTEQTESSYVFHLSSAQMNGTEIPLTCQCRLKTFCHISCPNEDIMLIATVPAYRGNVFNLYQFWIFLMTVSAFSSCAAITITLQNPICLDILEDKPEDYGKQKCWSSFGWGIFSIFIGWLVDWFSVGKKEKDYSPVFYSCILLTICNLFVISKLKVTETKKSKGKWKSIYGLFTKHYVIVFYIWVASTSFLHTIITHFLFWYMEDLVFANNNHDQRAWLKTLQGLAQGIQCFGGEIPFYFWSGCIIRKMGHINCMAIVMGAMAIRMYLYTVIWNPAWIIAIELLNGVSYALGGSVKMSYAKIMSPEDTTNTVIGIIALFDCIGESLGSLLGGYLFYSYGGVWSFRFFACSSALMCFLNILSNRFGLTKDLKNCNFVAVSTTENNQKQ
ncbi:major facilitator superfamily domain-containing protein 6-like protein B [Acyrthosiphon pisum]|uniref:Major facilitator superfamily associated domain-containing protein n=1 Tax=Acyrthosiphon pisum TaxID=7029 RepID=A0A8R2A6U5_ACYPI|nr:major facilitator superfamily domain-containing protein 6-like protein B [Acyrthosiphon pisum]|eukprot:XP_001946757.2 PREDICTED: major facilitator superfamily domain-containing protein 6-like protein B [Acyrthosiphon pisum]